MLRTYRIIGLRNQANADGSYEVNDAVDTGYRVDLDDDGGWIDVMREMKAVGAMAKHVQRRWLEFDEHGDGMCCTIRQKSTGKYLWQLDFA